MFFDFMSVENHSDILGKVAVSLGISRKEGQPPQDLWEQIKGRIDELHDGYNERNRKAVWSVISTVLEEVGVRWDDLPVLTKDVIARRLWEQGLPIIHNGKLK